MDVLGGAKSYLVIFLRQIFEKVDIITFNLPLLFYGTGGVKRGAGWGIMIIINREIVM